jgi:hypothetical protein
MRTHSNQLNQSLERFSNWLKNHYKVNGKNFKSYVTYSYYMQLAVTDLRIKQDQFFSINKPGLLKAILRSLRNSGLFKSRDTKLQRDIISSFKAYIKFNTSFQNFA